MVIHRYSHPPLPTDMGERARWNEGRCRSAMLSGQWIEYLERRLLEHFGWVRRPVLGRPSMARNPFRRLCADLAVCYDEPPIVRHEEGDAPHVAGRQGLLNTIGHWPQMRRLQMHLVGLREMLLRLDWSFELAQPVARQVMPHVVLAKGYTSAPHVAVEVRELRWREVNGKGMYAWDWISVADPDAPFFRVIEAGPDGRDGADITEAVLGARLEGSAYPYRWTQGARAGRPWLPYVVYHASRGAGLWDPYEGIEVVEGTLDVGCAYTFLGHIFRNAAWPQRWAVDVEVPGAVTQGTAGGARAEMPSDPTSLILLRGAEGPRPPQIGQWAPSADTESMGRVVQMLEQAVSEMDGLNARDVTRDTSNPWSAASLTITRDAQRKAQKRYWPELRDPDLGAIERLCCLQNIMGTGPALAEEGYDITYRSLPLSREEAEERRKGNAELIAQGRLSIVDAYMDEHPGMTREEAEAELKRIREDNERHGVVAGTAPTPLVQGAAEGREPKASDTDHADDGVEGEPKAGDAGAGAELAAAGVAKKADTALNGAQGELLNRLIDRIAQRLVPRAEGVKQIAFAFMVSADEAEELVGEVGRTFFQVAPAAAGTPPGGLANGQG